MSNEYYYQLAIDYLGASLRDNSAETIISIGKQIDSGDYD